ncbi:MAG: glycosyltransferase family 4 protein [Planctomycetia bacterium]
MKIAVVIGQYDAAGGGAERWTDRFARALLARGYNVHLVARRVVGAPAGARCHQIDVPRGAPAPRLAFAAAVEALCERMDFDAVQDNGDGWRADVFLPHHGTRWGGFGQNSRLVPPALRWTRPLAWRLLPRYREFQALEKRQFAPTPGKWFVAVSKMVAAHMRELYAVPADAVRVVYNGVDETRFAPATDAAAVKAVRERLGATDATTVALLVAHNFRLKGVDALLQATARLIRKKRDLMVCVVGAGAVKKYRRLADRLGCGDAVQFLGNQSDPLPLFQAADVYVQPTFYDPCSLVVLEALACGLPVITTACNGAGELLHGAVGGDAGTVLADPEDAVGLADALDRFGDEAARRPARQAARAVALEHTLARNVDAVAALFGAPRADRAAA